MSEKHEKHKTDNLGSLSVPVHSTCYGYNASRRSQVENKEEGEKQQLESTKNTKP